MLNNKYVISFTAALILSVSAGHAGNGKGNKGNGNGNGNNGNSGKVGICHLEADGTYTLLQLKTNAAMNHLENHSGADRVANEDGNCVFEPDVPDCPCLEQGDFITSWAGVDIVGMLELDQQSSVFFGFLDSNLTYFGVFGGDTPDGASVGCNARPVGQPDGQGESFIIPDISITVFVEACSAEVTALQAIRDFNNN